MKKIILKKVGSEEELFQGRFDTLKSCVERAVEQNVCLDYVDLRGANLVNAELDEGSFNHARFDYANLTGVNMSGANLEGACLRETALYNACLCEAMMSDVQFFGAEFGGTDIAWGTLNGACFDTVSALDLKFSEAMMMKGALFYDRTGTVCTASRAPIVMKGLQYNIVLFDDYMKVGPVILPYQSWIDLREGGALQNMAGDVAVFMRTYGRFLFVLAEVRARELSDAEQTAHKNVA